MGRWFMCGVCKCYLKSRSDYKKHYREKHNIIRKNSWEENTLQHVPKPCSVIRISPCWVKIIKVSLPLQNVSSGKDADSEFSECNSDSFTAQPTSSSDISSGSLSDAVPDRKRKRPISSAQPNSKPKLKCQKCGKIFSSSPSLNRHIISRHTNRKLKYALDRSELGIGKHRCNSCGKTFAEPIHLQRHIIARHTDHKPFQCKECGRRFARFDCLQSHLRNHSDKTYYKCDECGESFRFLSTYNWHKEWKHTPEENRKKFQCKLCEAYYFTKGKLATHQQTVHGIQKEKSFKCHICDKFLGSISGLKHHILMHTGEKPHKCPICDRSFTQNSNLTTHMQQIHDKTRNKSFACDKCDKSYYMQLHLSLHKKVHDEIKDHICSICRREFPTKGALGTHFRSHLEERAYKCQLCGSAFKHSSSLRQHIDLHLGDTPFKCDKCGKAYTQRVNLTKHQEKCPKKVKKTKKTKKTQIVKLNIDLNLN